MAIAASSLSVSASLLEPGKHACLGIDPCMFESLAH